MEETPQGSNKQGEINPVREVTKQKAKAMSHAKPTGRKRKALNKKEKLSVTKRLVALKPEVTTTVSLINVAKQLPTYNPRLKQVCTSVIPSTLSCFVSPFEGDFP